MKAEQKTKVRQEPTPCQTHFCSNNLDLQSPKAQIKVIVQLSDLLKRIIRGWGIIRYINSIIESVIW